MKKVNTVIIGAGQAGLSTSYCFTQKGIDHVVLEKGRVGEEWKSRRWDSFRLITPNSMTRLPGFSYKGNNPDGFDSRDEVVRFLEDYAKSFNAPVLENTKVISVTQNKNGFEVRTNNGDFESKNVIVATGSFHKPLIPKLAESFPKNILQIHSSEYKNAKQLPKGAVLVVGAGNSGVQIATDLNKAGRKVYLSLGKLRIVPRRYRGKDFMQWAELLGILDRTTAEATPEIKKLTPPLLLGTLETVNLQKLAKNGIQLLGRLTDFRENRFIFADDLSENVEKGESALIGFKKTVDQFIIDNKLDLPREEQKSTSKVDQKIMIELNVKEITSVMWATGFEYDYSWLKLPVLDKTNEPIHTKGVSKIPGLYFIGLRWLSKYKSFLLCGVAEDAEYLSTYF